MADEQPAWGGSPSLSSRIWRKLFGASRDPRDPHVHHTISLIAVLAWVGLGADGLSSSAYGPPEAFEALGDHFGIAVLIALATALTIGVISYAYSRIIEHFPHGGGGYIVATALLGKTPGVISACALLVDYVLTVTVSIAAAGDALFSLPAMFGQDTAFFNDLMQFKLPLEFAAIAVLTIMNLRGVKESIKPLVPIFLIFIVSHVVLIGGAIIAHLTAVPEVSHRVADSLQQSWSGLGGWGFFILFLRAYSMGAGTYTGIEAVSNGLPILREPAVETGKRTMIYMALSLAFVAGGLLLCYVLLGAHVQKDQTLNGVLARQFAGGWQLWGMPTGTWFVFIILISEALLLGIAAQAGFIDGPRVMSNMAADNWLPRRFASLSDRLTMRNGVLAIGLAATAVLAYTGGAIKTLVVMYSINVFLTFSLSEVGMLRFWFTSRAKYPRWKRDFSVHLTGFVMCASILMVMCIEKFTEGGWITLLITSLCIFGCFLIRGHYNAVSQRIARIDKAFAGLRVEPVNTLGVAKSVKLTGVVLVGSYGGLGIHSLLSVVRLFPTSFERFIFVSVGQVDASVFKDAAHVAELENKTRDMLAKYETLARQLGVEAESRYRISTDVVADVGAICSQIAQTYGRTVVIAGELVFDNPRWYHRLLHNQTVYAIQRQLRMIGLPMMVQPIRISLHDRPSKTPRELSPDLKELPPGQ